MRKSLGKVTIFGVLLLTLCTGLFLIAVWTLDDAVNYIPTLQVGTFDTTAISARSFEVFDVETGTEITSKEKDTVLPIASITKLITAGIVYRNGNLNATTSIQWSDIATLGDAGKLHYADVYTYRELLFPLLLESSNDASSVFERVYGDIESQMEAYATDENLSTMKFADASGLSSKNVATAHDLALIGAIMFKQYPHLFDITRLRQFIGTHTGWLNNNPLSNKDGYRGGKHGFTYEANRTVLAFFDEKLEGGHTRTFGYILLGSNDLEHDIEILRKETQEHVSFK